MRILYWTPFFLPSIGGIEILSAKVLPILHERGYDFTLVTSHGKHEVPDKTDYKGVPVYRFHIRTALSKRNLGQIAIIRSQIAKLKQSFKPDLVHVNFSDPNIFFHMSTLTSHAAPTLITLHTPILDYRGGPDSSLGKALRKADWVAAVSSELLSDYCQLFPEIKDRSSVIYNGMDMPHLKPQPLQFESPRLLCLGRLVYEKGFDLTITAFASLLERFPQARLVIAGDGPMLSELKNQASTLGVAESVDFPGMIDHDNIPDLINQSTVVIMSSRSEPFGIVALEAAQMARPVVAARVGGLPEIVIHKKTGILVEKGSSASLANAIKSILEHPDFSTQMGEAARIRARNMFSLDQYADTYDDLYKKLNRINEKKKVVQHI